MDIKLGNENNLVWENGDLKLVDGVEEIKQKILVALYTLIGEWLLDYTKGIDVPRGMREQSFLINDIKKQIKGVDGVTQIKKINVTRDGLTVNIVGAVATIYGMVYLNEGITQ